MSGEDTNVPAQLIAVQEEERKRLSRELHDSVGQILTALKMELAQVKGRDDAEGERLERIRAFADDAIQTIRDVSLMLRPTLLDDLGLREALEWHTTEFLRRTGLRCRLQYGLADASELPEDVKICIYRVIQEALNNCEKHALASEVQISVAQGGGEIEVRVVDNGRGLGGRAGGLGLLGMRERAHMLGGQLRLESNDGHGTSVTLTIPAPENL